MSAIFSPDPVTVVGKNRAATSRDCAQGGGGSDLAFVTSAPQVSVGAVLLASGFGRRFGGNKLFAEIEGKTLLARAFSALPPALFAHSAVTSQYDEALALARQNGYLPLKNDQAEEGIAAGLRLGLAALQALDGVLFAVCDQPYLTRESVRRLVAAFQQNPQNIVALGFRGARGNPVIFPNDLFPALLALTGERGGATVLHLHPERLLVVEAGAARELEDVDIQKRAE